jgi:hypothetical protein
VRRRILQSTLLAVAITALVLGGPLALTTWQLVEDFDRAGWSPAWSRWRPPSTTRAPPSTAAGLELAVPAGGRLVVAVEAARRWSSGSTPAWTPVAESLPFRPGGVITLESRARSCAPSSCRSPRSCCC